MNNQFAIKALLALKDRQDKLHELYKLNVNLIEFDEGLTNKLEESIAIILSKGDKKNFKFILDDIGWWVYESVNKIITLKNSKEVDVNKVEDFVKWINRHYRK